MKPLVHVLAFVPVLILGLVGGGLAQLPPAPTPTLSAAGPCPAVARFDFDVSGIPNADRVLWQIRRGAPGQNFGAATQVDTGTALGTSGSLEKDLRAYGPVLDGTRYFFRIRARQGGNDVSAFSEPVVFEQDLSPNGMFTPSAGAAPGSLRVDWTLTGEIAACAQEPPAAARVAVRIDKVGGATPLQSVEPGVSGSRTFDLTAQGPGDYDVRIHARHGGDTADDAVGRESAPVRRTLLESQPALAVSIDDLSFPEGNAGNAQNAVVRLSAPASQSVTVLVGARPGGTATEGACGAGRDVTFAFRTVTLNPGQTELSVPFTICGDTAFENDETFSLGLTSAVNAALGDSVGNVTIRNDDKGVEQSAQAPILPNLQVTVDARPQFQTQQGPLLVHVLTVRNTGAGAASNVVVQSTLPAGVRFVRVEENQFDGCTGGVITDAAGQALVRCSVSALPAGANRIVRIVGEVAGAIQDSTRVVFGINVDPERVVPETSEGDNFAFLSTVVRLLSDVQLTVKGVFTRTSTINFVGAICSRDATIVVTLTVRNAGPFGSRAAPISAAWPDGFVVPFVGCFDTCAAPALAPGASTDVQLAARLSPAGLGGPREARFTVDPEGSLLDPIVANNTTTAVVCE